MHSIRRPRVKGRDVIHHPPGTLGEWQVLTNLTGNMILRLGCVVTLQLVLVDRVPWLRVSFAYFSQASIQGICFVISNVDFSRLGILFIYLFILKKYPHTRDRPREGLPRDRGDVRFPNWWPMV